MNDKLLEVVMTFRDKFSPKVAKAAEKSGKAFEGMTRAAILAQTKAGAVWSTTQYRAYLAADAVEKATGRMKKSFLSTVGIIKPLIQAFKTMAIVVAALYVLRRIGMLFQWVKKQIVLLINQADKLSEYFVKLSEITGNTFTDAMSRLDTTWNIFMGTLGEYITRSPKVIAGLKFISDELLNLVGATDDARMASEDLVGSAFVKIIDGAIWVGRGMLALGRSFAQLSIWIKQASIALHNIYIGFADMPDAVRAVVDPVGLLLTQLGLLDSDATYAKGAVVLLAEEINNLTADINASFNSTDVLTEAQAELARIIAGATGVIERAGGPLQNMSSDLGAVAEAASSAAGAVHDLSKAIAFFPSQIFEDFQFPQPPGYVPELPGLRFPLRGQPSPREDLTDYIQEKFINAPDFGGRLTPMELKLNRKPGGFARTGLKNGQTYEEARAARGMGDSFGKLSDLNEQQLLGTAIQGFSQGGLAGGAAALLPAIGSAFGPVGTAVGSLLGGLFGGKKKPRGNDPSKPVFVSDVSMANILTDLLNITKSQLARAASGGVNAINSQIRAQAGTSGAV